MSRALPSGVMTNICSTLGGKHLRTRPACTSCSLSRSNVPVSRKKLIRLRRPKFPEAHDFLVWRGGVQKSRQCIVELGEVPGRQIVPIAHGETILVDLQTFRTDSSSWQAASVRVMEISPN
jgi:hypothetical protein